MIRVIRKTRPKILKTKANGWQKILLAATTRKEKKAASNKYNHESVKKTLILMFHGKCAYCESKITHIDYGHIEHYRPKSGPVGRPDLTFAWSNLLLACGVCNGPEHKGSRFPGPTDSGPIINPCKDDPNIHLSFQYDPVTKLASVYGVTARGSTTEKLLGLNRLEWRDHRSKYIIRLVVLATMAATNSEAADLIREAKESCSPYAAFARALF
jgi:uncharacterized protein (TIGR02646 family)